MGFLGNLIERILSTSSSEQERRSSEPVKRYTPEEYRIYEQEQSRECWHGVPLSELSRVAQNTYRGKYVTVDQYGFLVFHYSSNSKKTNFSAQCELDENGRIRRLPHGYYPGQWTDSADKFIELANQEFIFR